MCSHKHNNNFCYFLSFVILVYGINYCSDKYPNDSNRLSASTVISNKQDNSNIIYKKEDKASKTEHYSNKAYNKYNKHNKQTKTYRISQNGKRHIKKYESCVLNVYNIKDSKGRKERYNTIGWGHQLRPGDRYYNRQSITQSEADRLFEADIETINESVNRLLSELDDRFEPTQEFIDGFGSLVYNCGETGIRNSVLFKRLKRCRYNNNSINKKDYEYAVSSVRNMYITHKGHIDRRETECLLMQGIL